MRDLFSILWCSDRSSHGATAEAIYGLGVTDLRNGDGWPKLAAMPSCTDCHARLDYGMQFFRGFASSYDSLFAGRELVAPGTGPLYGNDVSDLRGHADLTPAGFARLAVAQPELATCAVQRVSRYDHRLAPPRRPAAPAAPASHQTLRPSGLRCPRGPPMSPPVMRPVPPERVSIVVLARPDGARGDPLRRRWERRCRDRLACAFVTA
jgi:hypothetical protein